MITTYSCSIKPMKNLALRLLKAREALGYSQVELARLSNEPQQYIQKLEKGISRTLNTNKLLKVAKALESDPGWLTFGNGQPPSYLQDEVPTNLIPIISWEHCKEIYLNKDNNIDCKNNDFLPFMLSKDNGKRLYALPVGPDNTKPIFYIILDPHIKPKTNDYIVAYSKLWSAVSYAYLSEKNGKTYIMPAPILGESPKFNSSEATELSDAYQVVGKVIAHISISD